MVMIDTVDTRLKKRDEAPPTLNKYSDKDDIYNLAEEYANQR